MDNKNKKQKSSVGNVGPKPGDFPVGSMESRAAARSRLERANREKPMFRVFENGILVTEEPHDWDFPGDVEISMNYIGRCAEEMTEPVEPNRLASSEGKESQQSRTDRDRHQNTPNEEAVLEAAREARVIEYGKYLARRWRPRRGYRPRFR